MTEGHARAWCAAALWATAAACSNDLPTAPTGPMLAPGAYVLSITATTSATLPLQCEETSLPASRADVPVVVTHAGNTWIVEPEGAANLGFRATLRSEGASGLNGPAAGTARDAAGVVVTVEGTPGPGGPGIGLPSGMLGTLSGPRAASGSLVGQVRLSRDGQSRRCPVNQWALSAR